MPITLADNTQINVSELVRIIDMLLTEIRKARELRVNYYVAEIIAEKNANVFATRLYTRTWDEKKTLDYLRSKKDIQFILLNNFMSKETGQLVNFRNVLASYILGRVNESIPFSLDMIRNIFIQAINGLSDTALEYKLEDWMKAIIIPEPPPPKKEGRKPRKKKVKPLNPKRFLEI
jgi:hypothetical protein